MIYLGNNAPVMYLPGLLGAEPVMAPDQTPFTTQTAVEVSPNSTLLQAVAEIKSIWDIHSHADAPTFVSCSEDMQVIATVLCAEFGGIKFNGVVA